MSKFTILHLSDSHIGKTENDQPTVLKPLIDSIKKESEERSLSPNLIVFSGDLVQGCKDECSQGCKNDDSPPENCKLEYQYKKADEFLKEVFKAISKNPGEVPLLIVPGNHDVNRHSIDDDFFEAREGYTADSVLSKQQKTNKRGWLSRVLPQKRWLKFAQNFPNHSSIIWDDNYCVPYGCIEHDGVTIGLIGLNSSWAAGNDSDSQKLWIGREQYQRLFGLVEHAKFKIVAIHHPVSYLNEGEKIDFEKFLELQSQIFFHGHEHSGWYVLSENHLRMDGGAVYQESKKENGYSWVDLDFKIGEARVHLFKLTTEGSYTWIPRNIPQKTDVHGIGKINGLVSKYRDSSQENKAVEPEKTRNETSLVKYKMKDSLLGVIDQLESQFEVTWEPHAFNESCEQKHVFWPMKLREPTAIHASQCFIAAALQKKGCSINLYIDDFSDDYQVSRFEAQIKRWFKRVGADPDDIKVEKYKEIVDRDTQKKREILENLLLEALSTIEVLKISKIYKSQQTTEDLLNTLKNKKPRRILTPAMTWTCLESLSAMNENASIITLGGYDERVLWSTWRTCLKENGISAGHLFLSELKGIHMQDINFSWKSKNDIESYFSAAREAEGIANASSGSMIPWCINNCALIPTFVSEKEMFMINGKPCATLKDILRENSNIETNDFISTIVKWVL